LAPQSLASAPTVSTEPATASEMPAAGASAGWVRPLVLAASCLVLGFVGGWVLRGDGGKSVVLPAAPTDAVATTPSRPRVVTTPTARPPKAARVSRATVTVAVLNGSGVGGLAGKTSARAVSAGYAQDKVVVGNAPAQSGPSTVYYRPGARAAAQQAGRDLGIAKVLPIPTGTAGTDLISLTPEAASSQVVVVLGTG
jgi:hypothetical protein